MKKQKPIKYSFTVPHEIGQYLNVQDWDEIELRLAAIADSVREKVFIRKHQLTGIILV